MNFCSSTVISPAFLLRAQQEGRHGSSLHSASSSRHVNKFPQLRADVETVYVAIWPKSQISTDIVLAIEGMGSNLEAPGCIHANPHALNDCPVGFMLQQQNHVPICKHPKGKRSLLIRILRCPNPPPPRRFHWKSGHVNALSLPACA